MNALVDDLLERLMWALQDARESDEVVVIEASKEIMIVMNEVVLKDDGSTEGFMKGLCL